MSFPRFVALVGRRAPGVIGAAWITPGEHVHDLHPSSSEWRPGEVVIGRLIASQPNGRHLASPESGR